MAGFDLLHILKIVKPDMVLRGLVHPWRTAIHVARARYPQRRGLALWPAVLREINRRPAPSLPAAAFEPMGSVLAVEQSAPHRVTIAAQGGRLQVMALAGDLFQVRFQRGDHFPDDFSYSVAKPADDWPIPPVSITETEEAITLKTATLRLTIERSSCRLTLFDAAGSPLLREADGAASHAGGSSMWSAVLPADVPVYGLGEKAGQIDHTGRRLELFNIDPICYNRGDDPLYMSIPFLMMLVEGQGVGVFFDNSYRAWVDIGQAEPGTLRYQTSGGELRLYLMAGTPTQVLERYTELTGRMSLPPLWALGLHQSRWSYYPEARVREIANEFRARRIPCDVIHFDIDYMDGYRCFTWDHGRFPNPKALLDDLHTQGFKGIAIIDPGIKVDPGYRVYDEGVARRAFIQYPDGTPFTGPVWPGDCHFPDFTNPEVRAWWGDQYAGLLDSGLDAFWNDMNEIALITNRRATTVPDVVRHHYEGRGADHARIHNLYGMQMARASVEGLARLRPDRRPLILSRSGWAGLQRYAIHWTGDNFSTWDHLLLSIQMVLTLGLSGIPITGPDIGGFSGEPTPELFARWIEVGAFMPFCRIHSSAGTPDQEPWSFGPEVEAISRRYLELRYRLLPYLYTAVWQAATTGLPIVRPLMLAYPDDLHARRIDDQFLFGSAILVAPIVEQGAASRSIYLPCGEWYDFWSNQLHQGGQTIEVSAPLDTLPLFVRAGSVIPLWEAQQYVGEKPLDALTLLAYRADGEHHSILYEDDGVSTAYRTQGQYRLSHLLVRGEGQGHGSVEHRIQEGAYRPTYSEVHLHLIGFEAGDPRLTGAQLSGQSEDRGTRILRLRLEGEGGFRVEI
ncbi:MAG: glycoside hydrolase family 31 protein [Anaerolineae bacterium]